MNSHSMVAGDWDDDGVPRQTLEVVGNTVPLVFVPGPSKFLTARVLPYETNTYFVVPETPGRKVDVQ